MTRFTRRNKPNPAPPSHRHTMRQIWVLVAAAFVIALGFGLIAPVLPEFARSFNVGITAASAIVSVFALTRLMFAPASGQLVQRLGERPVYLGGLAIVALSTAACAVAQTYWQLMVFRAFGGIGSTMFTISAMALLIRLAPPDMRGRVNSLYSSAFLIGSIGGPLVGGLLGGLGLRVPFVVYAAALVVAILVVQTQLEVTKPGATDQQGTREEFLVRDAMRDPAYRAALLANLAHGWATFGVRVAVIPLFVTVTLAAGPRLAGLALATFSAGMAVVLITGGRLSDRFGRRRPTIVGLLIAGGATVALGFSELTWVFLALCVIGGVGTGLFVPAQQAAVADIVGSNRNGGRALATFQMTSDFGAIVGPVLAGLLAETVSYAAAFGFTGAMLILAALYWIVAPETLTRALAEQGRESQSSGRVGAGDEAE
ncbi:MFS transporter [Hoyosella sp. YIM 151337]|uniref:MFS transporter n=1 Tax=Hoyosella sp. YIM 151337 TaxID=2992742 RepID=UPI0022365CAB|nr:MFS transporter [Hoyosella sp. YIM 151337]MCW4355160.1 MFS transporter [Hoyosella sp. YIM 151337]